jgi:hypothetical protein
MVLRRLIGLLVVVGVLFGVGRVFWNAMHPSVTPQGGQQQGTYQGPPSPYSTEGGHDPNRAFGNTQDELKFRGANLDTKKFQ